MKNTKEVKQIIEMIEREEAISSRLSEQFKNAWLQEKDKQKSDANYRLYKTFESSANTLNLIINDIKKEVSK